MSAVAGWLDQFVGSQAAPWLWWGVALVVIVVLLLLGLKMLGLLPE